MIFLLENGQLPYISRLQIFLKTHFSKRFKRELKKNTREKVTTVENLTRKTFWGQENVL